MRQPREADAIFTANVRRLRAARGLALRDLASRCGLGHTIIYRIENGQPALLAHAIAISAEFGVPLIKMLGPGPCEVCFGRPPTGFACLSCGAGNREIAATTEGDAA